MALSGDAATLADDVRIVPRLGPGDVGRLAPLIAAYAGALLGREPGAPDESYAAKLLAEPIVEIAGAELGGRIVGFALYYDLPEAISGKRAGQMDDLFVLPEARGRGIAARLVAHLAEEGARRGWVHLRWMAPDASPAHALYERVAERAPWRNYVVRIDRAVAW